MPLPCIDTSPRSAARHSTSGPTATLFVGRLPFMIAPLLLLSLVAFHSHQCLAADTPTTAIKMISGDAQAAVIFPNAQTFFANWNKTQLGLLAKDPSLDQFWKTQRDEIQSRFADAGWQLKLKVEDIESIANGQAAIAWIARPSVAKKPFSIAMIMDVVDRTEQAKSLLERIDTELKGLKATLKTKVIAGATVSEYSLPPIKGEIRIKETYYVLSKDQLLAADDEATITELLNAQSGSMDHALADAELYKKIQTKLAGDGDTPEVEYFVRPLGMANLLRAISGKGVGNQPDILKILENQGFGDIQAVAGNVQLAFDKFDAFHHGFVLVKTPLTGSAQILDFPNAEDLKAPSWLSANTASVLGLSWNIKNAFPHFKGIVDEYVNMGTFDEVIKGIRTDPNGPQIDIYNDVLPYISNELFVITEISQPITPDSKRSMIVLRLNDSKSKLKSVLDRFGKNEPNATAEDYEGYRIYKVVNEDAADKHAVDLDDFDDKKTKKSDTDGDEQPDEAPLLPHWAVTIMDQYFIFSSDLEMIHEAIRNAKDPKAKDAFWKLGVVESTQEMLNTVAANETRSATHIDIAERSFEMQYELFRQGILPESRSMMASILDRILNPRDHKHANQQKINGANLPPFEQIKSYFTPSGGVVRTEEDGISIQGFVLGKQ